VLHVMFDGNVRWIYDWTDNYYEITDRNGHIFRWMKILHDDEWSACGWSKGNKDSAKLVSALDYDSFNARVTGRFWFDTRVIGGDSESACDPNRYPDGSPMTDDDDLFDYYGKVLFPLTVRYNAGLLGLANRQVTIRDVSLKLLLRAL